MLGKFDELLQCKFALFFVPQSFFSDVLRLAEMPALREFMIGESLISASFASEW